MATKPYVRIQSSTTIMVTAGLQNQDVTNKDAHIPDRLKVNPLWPKMTCLIKTGVGVYPSDIVEWPVVKSLVKDNVLTIGEYLDTADEVAEVKKKQIVEMKQEIERTKKASSLAEIAGE